MRVFIGRRTSRAFALRSSGLALKGFALFYAIGVVVPFTLGRFADASTNVRLDAIVGTTILTLAGLSLFSGYPWSALGRGLRRRRTLVQFVLMSAVSAVFAIGIVASIVGKILPSLLLFLALDVSGLTLFLIGSRLLNGNLKRATGLIMHEIVTTCERDLDHHFGYARPRSAGLAFIFASALSVLLVAFITALSSNALSSEVILVIAIIIVVVLSGAGLAKLVVIYLSPDARSILHVPNAKAVLLLRSFVDEGSRVGTWWMRDRIETIAKQSFENRGAFVAIGNPKEAIPTLGALRTYAGNDDWQALFASFVDRSDTIVMIAGTSNWLGWELRDLQSRQVLDRLIVAFPNYAAKARIDAARFILGALHPSPSVDALGGEIDNLLYLAFKKTGEPVTVKSESKAPAAYRLGALLALYAARQLDGEDIELR